MYCVSALSYNYMILCEQISPTTSVMSVPSRHLHVTSSVTFHQHLLHPFSGPTYAQLTCLLWKRILNEYCDLVVEKLQYTVHITVNLYGQSPSDVQCSIISKFCSSPQILLLCTKLAIIAIKGRYNT